MLGNRFETVTLSFGSLKYPTAANGYRQLTAALPLGLAVSGGLTSIVAIPVKGHSGVQPPSRPLTVPAEATGCWLQPLPLYYSIYVHSSIAATSAIGAIPLCTRHMALSATGGSCRYSFSECISLIELPVVPLVALRRYYLNAEHSTRQCSNDIDSAACSY